MRIVDWNVGSLNPNKMEGLRYIFSLKPDVITLQELPENIANQIEREFPEYEYVYADQWRSTVTWERYLLAIYSKKPILNVKTFDLYNPKFKSLYRKFMYDSFLKVEEKPTCIVVTTKHYSQKINILTTQLSVSLKPAERMLQLGEIFAKINPKEVNLLCGDLNITNSKLFKYVIGLVRNYTKKDFGLNEVDLAKRLFNNLEFANVFKGFSTCGPKFLKLQFDHVLVPSDVEVLRKKSHGKMRSDHTILSCDLRI